MILDVARGIGTGRPATHDYLSRFGAEAVAYGPGMTARTREFAPDGVDLALDVAGHGALPELIELAGGPEHVITIAHFAGANVTVSASAAAIPAAPSTPSARLVT